MKPGWQYLHMGYKCLTLSSFQHELLHILGFLHEQQSYQRDDFLFVNETVLQKFATRSIRNYRIVRKNLLAQNPFPFELDSLMMYKDEFFNKGSNI